jgi:hypothetical protein
MPPREIVTPGAGSGPVPLVAGSSQPCPGRLRSGQLGTRDLTVSTVANIGPGTDFYFAFVVIVVTAGVAAPLVTVGYTVAMTGVFAMSGGLLALTLAHYASLSVPGGPLTLVLTAAAIWVTARGVKLSTAAIGVALVAQIAVTMAVCVAALTGQRRHLSVVPFPGAHLTGGLAGCRGASRWRGRCSSAGRTARPWQKSAATRSEPCPGLCTSRLWPARCSSSCSRSNCRHVFGPSPR